MRDGQPVTEVNEGDALDVKCTVERVYPLADFSFKVATGTEPLTDIETGDNATNSDGTYSVTMTFENITFSREYMVSGSKLKCLVHYSGPGSVRGRQQLQITVNCKLTNHKPYTSFSQIF